MQVISTYINHSRPLIPDNLLGRSLKMLGLYLDTLIIGQNNCNVLSILNELTLQKKLQNFLTNNVLDNKVKHNNKTEN